jgi:hypothetical protein
MSSVQVQFIILLEIENERFVDQTSLDNWRSRSPRVDSSTKHFRHTQRPFTDFDRERRTRGRRQ